MKKLYHYVISLLLVTFLVTAEVRAQWCEPDINPYGPSTPGITNFMLNTINRDSPDLENSGNNFTITGEGTTLIKGQTYSVSITHTVDNLICPDMNLRVWIDYNLDYTFEDAGETVMTIDHHLPGTYTATFTVPETAITGITRLRATAKMSNLGGHTPPTSCNIPPDPLDYHGEVEDYEITLESSTGFDEMNGSVIAGEIFPNPASNEATLPYRVRYPSGVNIDLYSIHGESMRVISSSHQVVAGDHEVIIDCAVLTEGIYLVRIESDNNTIYPKLSVIH